jgi:hypothetical protein
MKEKYIFPIFDGLYKIDETGELPRLSLSCYKTCILRSFGSTLYNANNGFINKFDIIAIHKRNFFSSSQFGKSIVWEFEKIKKTVFAASWGFNLMVDCTVFA